MKKLILLLLVLVLSSCAKDKSLNPPENIRFDSTSNLLTWDVEDGAFSYQISINDVIYNTESLEFDLSILLPGNYTIKIKSISNDKESRYSLPISIVIDQPLALSIFINDEQISWSAIPQATKYTIYISDINNTVIETSHSTNTYYSILDLYGIYRISVVAYRDDLVLTEKEFILDASGYVFSTNQSSFNISYAYTVSSIYISDFSVPANMYIVSPNILSIDGNYLSSLSLGNHTVVINSEIPYYFVLTIDNVQIPYIISDSIVTFTDTDLVFMFELYEGSFSGITSNYSLLVSDYVVIDGELTIKSAYFDRIISENPELNQIVLTYLLVNGSYNQYGYITIKLN